ncbi:MAG: SprB repeat-containing protein [Bacteroidetes bacterium]|nr:SprB repeat-containing protein [Bacteroidota bacterium]
MAAQRLTHTWSNGKTHPNNGYGRTYTATVTDSKGCTAKCSYTVTEPTYVVAMCSGTNVNCYGGNNGSASVTASGGTPSYTYWSNGKTTSSNNNLSAGTYTATVTDANGCTATCSYSNTTNIIGSKLQRHECNVQRRIDRFSSGGSKWRHSALHILMEQWKNHSLEQRLIGRNVHSDSNRLKRLHSKMFIHSNRAKLCSSNVQWHECKLLRRQQWQRKRNSKWRHTIIHIQWSNGKTTSSNSNLSAGTYTATVTDANGCTATCSYTVTQPTPLVATCSGTNVTCKGASTGSAAVVASGGTAPYTYLWSNGKTTASNNGLSAGTYTATVTDSKGCTAKCSYTVTEPSYVVATCSGTNVNCYGGNNGSASVTASGGTPSYTYMWSNGKTTSSNSNLSAGTYTATVTDANGCTATCSYTVTQPTLLVATCSGTQ